jgi:hypothetical protein
MLPSRHLDNFAHVTAPREWHGQRPGWVKSAGHWHEHCGTDVCFGPGAEDDGLHVAGMTSTVSFGPMRVLSSTRITP